MCAACKIGCVKYFTNDIRKRHHKVSYLKFSVTAQLISAFVFATQIEQFLFFLNPIFQAFSLFSGTVQADFVGPGFITHRLSCSQRSKNKVDGRTGDRVRVGLGGWPSRQFQGGRSTKIVVISSAVFSHS